MATEVVMPKLGLTMERGTIGAWLKAEGDLVERGEALLEVVTDKVTMEVEAQASGVLRRIFVQAGEEVDVATPIAVIAAADEEIDHFGPPPAAPAMARPVAAAAIPSPPSPPVLSAAQVTAHAGAHVVAGGRPHRASPKARRIAAEQGIDLSQVEGSGPSGRIVSADVEARRGVVVAQVHSAPSGGIPSGRPSGQTVELTHPQKIAAERLTASYQQAPHIYLETPVSAVWLEQFRTGYAAEGRKVSYNDLIIKAVATALREHPRLNSHF
ncbi:MAG: E3 binding domain-containing protein, partial [bacterium]|nr:E3 binding domain-containing protein [bacterium]